MMGFFVWLFFLCVCVSMYVLNLACRKFWDQWLYLLGVELAIVGIFCNKFKLERNLEAEKKQKHMFVCVSISSCELLLLIYV